MASSGTGPATFDPQAAMLRATEQLTEQVKKVADYIDARGAPTLEASNSRASALTQQGMWLPQGYFEERRISSAANVFGVPMTQGAGVLGGSASTPQAAAEARASLGRGKRSQAEPVEGEPQQPGEISADASPGEEHAHFGGQYQRRSEEETGVAGEAPSSVKGLSQKQYEKAAKEPFTIPEYQWRLDAKLKYARDAAIKLRQRTGPDSSLGKAAGTFASVANTAFRYAAPIEGAGKVYGKVWEGMEAAQQMGYSAQDIPGGEYIAGFRNPLALFSSAGERAAEKRANVMDISRFGTGVSEKQAKALSEALAKGGSYTGEQEGNIMNALQPALKEGANPQEVAQFALSLKYTAGGVKELATVTKGLGDAAKATHMNLTQVMEDMQTYTKEAEGFGVNPARGLERAHLLQLGTGLPAAQTQALLNTTMGNVAAVQQGLLPGMQNSLGAGRQLGTAESGLAKEREMIQGFVASQMAALGPGANKTEVEAGLLHNIFHNPISEPELRKRIEEQKTLPYREKLLENTTTLNRALPGWAGAYQRSHPSGLHGIEGLASKLQPWLGNKGALEQGEWARAGVEGGINQTLMPGWAARQALHGISGVIPTVAPVTDWLAGAEQSAQGFISNIGGDIAEAGEKGYHGLFGGYTAKEKREKAENKAFENYRFDPSTGKKVATGGITVGELMKSDISQLRGMGESDKAIKDLEKKHGLDKQKAIEQHLGEKTEQKEGEENLERNGVLIGLTKDAKNLVKFENKGQNGANARAGGQPLNLQAIKPNNANPEITAFVKHLETSQAG